MEYWNLYFRKFVLVLWLISLHILGYGQDSSKKKDSLWQVHNNSSILEERIDILNDLAYLYTHLPGLLDSGLILLDLALPMANDQEYALGQGENYLNRAIHYSTKGAFIDAAKYANKAKSIFKEIKDDDRLFRSCVSLGYYEYSNGEFAKAEQTLLTVIEDIPQDQFDDYRSAAYHNLAMIYQNNGQTTKALLYYEKSLQTKRKIYKNAPSDVNNRRVANTLDALGGLYQESSQLELAIKYYEEGLEIRRSVGFQQGIIVSLYNIGTYYERTEQFETASKYYSEALGIAKEIGNLQLQSYCLTGLANAYEKTDQIDLAINTCEEALSISKSTKNSISQRSVYQTLGKLYSSKGDYPLALEASQNALNLAAELREIPNVILARKLIADIHDKLGDKTQAITELKLAMSLMDSLNSEVIKDEIVETKEQLNTETEMSLELLKMENDLKQALISKRTNTIIGLSIGLLLISILLSQIWVSNKKLKKSLSTQHQQNLRLNDLSNKLQQFVFAASHDLKESLRGMVSFSQLIIKTSPKTNENLAFQKNIMRSGDKMKNTLNNLVEYANLSADQMVFEEVDLNSICQEVLAERKLLESTSLNIPMQELGKVRGNHTLLVKLFDLLIENAQKYSQKEVPLSLEIGHLKQEAGFKTSYIKDNGIGVEEEYLDQLFKPFFRIHDRSLSGAGLGLALCEQIVTLHNGKIWAEANQEDGISIIFQLPENES